MSYSSIGVKSWRKRTKQRMVDSMDNCCVICGYKKCQYALEFHHLDPSKKDFSFGAIRADIISWNSIVEELRKCVLLCSNCHKEVHAGISTIPINASSFSEEYAEYRKEKIIEMNACLVCGTMKNSALVTCSKKCAGKRTWHINWDQYDLPALIKQKSIVQIAYELGVSDSAIHKRLKKLNIPI